MTTSELKKRLADKRYGEEEIRLISQTISPDEIYSCLFDSDKRTADNAAWALTKLSKEGRTFLQTKHNELIEEAMRTKSTTKRRLIMTIIEKQKFCKETIRTDFIDFCLDKIICAEEAVGVRSLAVKLAYAQCSLYPELTAELKMVLEQLDAASLLPGLKSIRKRTLDKIGNLKINDNNK